jgi:hypothetical protein
MPLILDFEPQVGSRGDWVRLRLFRGEREYFEAKRHPVPEFNVLLPRPFQDTALMDSGGWRRRPRPAGPAQDLGYRMWGNLPESVRDAMLAGSADPPQRVAILSTHTGLDDIPWEWLNAGPQLLLAAMDSVRFVRFVPTLYAPPPLTVAPPIRILIVLTNPKDERLLQPWVEVDMVTQGLRGNENYEVRELLEPRLDALRAELEWLPHIIHYIGHAGISGTTGNLILHDEQEGTRWCPPTVIAHLLPASVRLTCLSTCVTAENYQIGGLAKVAHCSAELSLPTAVVNQYALGQTATQVFWQAFYPVLIQQDGNVVEAFHQARMAARAASLDTWDWASFSLIVRDGTGQPLRLARSAEEPRRRFAAELQAHWAARLANNVALRMRSLESDVQQHWEKTLADEAARVGSFERDLEI